MNSTVTFAPASINFPVTQIGGAAAASTSCGGVPATVNVTAAISDDTSAGALTVETVRSYIIETEIESGSGEGPSGGGLKPVKIAVTDYLGEGNPLNVLSGQAIEVDLRFAPTASTPYNCSATLVISGDTWPEPIQVPLTAIVGEVQVNVPAITVAQNQSTTVPVTISLSSGPDVTVSLAVEEYSTLSPVGILSVDESPAAISSSPAVSATRNLTASGGGLAPGAYPFYLAVSVFGSNAYSFNATITLNVVLPYFVIKSKTGNVIDILGAKTSPPAVLDAYPENSPASDNQLWTFIADPAGSGCYFIASKLNGNVIDIEGASTTAGTLLDAYPQKPTGTDNQLWCFVSDPEGSGFCFIVSKLNVNALNANVVDIQGNSTAPKTLLDSYPVKLTNYENQLWTVVDGAFPAILDPVPTLKPTSTTPGGFVAGNVNYYIFAEGEALTGASVSVTITSDFTSTANGYSFQLNCYSTVGPTVTTLWQQFLIRVKAGSNQLVANITTWTGQSSSDWFFYQDVPFATLPSSTIPQGYTLNIALNYLPDEGGYLDLSTALVSGATFTVTDASGNSIGSTTITLLGNTGQTLSNPVTVANLAPVAAMQLNIGGYGSNSTATLTQGAGTITYAASVGLNANSTKPTALVDFENFTNVGTGENANVIFGPVPWPFSPSMENDLPGLQIVQLFEVLPGQTPPPGLRKVIHALPLPSENPRLGTAIAPSSSP